MDGLTQIDIDGRDLGLDIVDDGGDRIAGATDVNPARAAVAEMRMVWREGIVMWSVIERE